MERRELIQWLVATAGLQSLENLAPADLMALGRDLHLPSPRGQAALRTLSPHAAATVTAAAERILPATDTPGATEAGVTAFIDKMLTDWQTQSERDRFLAGLPELDSRARALRSRDFAESAEADQVAVLTALDDELTALRASRGSPLANQHWFALLKYLSIYGYCTSEVGMRRALHLYPMAGRYDGCAPVPAAGGGGQS